MTYEYIHMATDDLLAELLEDYNKWRRGEHPYDGETPETFLQCPFEPKELGVLLDECARRLRMPKAPYNAFNDEAYDI